MPMTRPCARCVALLLAAVVSHLAASAASAGSPQLSIVRPAGAQRGTEVELTLSGDRLKDAQEVILYYPGISVTKLEAEDKKIKAQVKIAPDCRLGEHALRVRTASGVTELRTFYVGALPTVAEKDPNDEFSTPQKIDLNVTVDGVVKGEDVDYYAVDLKKGQRLTAEIEGLRLGRRFFDPSVAILDSRRFELDFSDDEALVRQDCIASTVAPEDGTYIIQVRESAYRAQGDCEYRLHVGNFPQPTAVYPAGGKPGEEIEVKFLGDVAGVMTQKVTLPAQADDNFVLFAEDAGGISSTGIPFRLTDFGNAMEVEPNETPEQATPFSLPLAANGIIEKEGDVDHFRFTAKKGEVFEVQCYARRLRSPLDPVVSIHVLGGGQVAANDDSGGPDSYFRFTAPDDKEYVLKITDHLATGGADYIYRVEMTPVKPSLVLSIPKVRQYSQERQAVVVPRGNRYATLISATRNNTGGEVALGVEGLPQGITVTAENIPEGVAAVPVIFEAPADAPIAGSLAKVTGKNPDPKQEVPASFTQLTELVEGQNQQSYWNHTVDRLAVAVAEEAPFKLNIVEPKVPIVQNGSLELKIVAERKEGFTAPITVEMLFNPPGISSATNVTIPEGKTEVVYPINANASAAAKKWKIAVNGSATVDGGAVVVSSQLATLEVAAPFVQFTMERTAAEQGQQAQIVCKIQQNTPFDGSAKVQLMGFPAKVTAPELEITKDTAELIFPVTIDAESPPGRHKSVVGRATIIKDGEPIVHNLGSTELRIDAPRKKKEEKPKAEEVAKAEPPKPAAAKPLSRLEQLRLEAQQAAAK